MVYGDVIEVRISSDFWGNNDEKDGNTEVQDVALEALK